jgi:hypothetical protein
MHYTLLAIDHVLWIDETLQIFSNTVDCHEGVIELDPYGCVPRPLFDRGDSLYDIDRR